MPSPLTLLSEILSAESTDALDRAFGQAVSWIGGNGYSIVSFPRNGRDFRQHLTTGLRPWVEYYAEANLVRSCPIASAIMTGTRPFTVDEVRLRAMQDGKDLAVFRAAQAYGIVHGLNVPVRTRAGQHGCVFIPYDSAEPSPSDIANATLFALGAHLRFEQIGREAQPSDRLSHREMEVLRWFALGKSTEDVADILGLSPATVMFHYRNVATRYGTLSRTHTVVEAVRRGAITLE